MSIPYLRDKIKGVGGVDKSLILQVIIIVFVGIGAFVLGRISINIQEHENVSIVNREKGSQSSANEIKPSDFTKDDLSPNTDLSISSRAYVASKNGKLYYRIGCGASSRILESNQVFFSNETEAQSAGFNPSDSCTP